MGTIFRLSAIIFLVLVLPKFVIANPLNLQSFLTENNKKLNKTGIVGFFDNSLIPSEFKAQTEEIIRQASSTSFNSNIDFLSKENLWAEIQALARIQELSYLRFKKECNPVKRDNGSLEICYDSNLVQRYAIAQKQLKEAFDIRIQALEKKLKKKFILSCGIESENYSGTEIRLINPNVLNMSINDFNSLLSADPIWDFRRNKSSADEILSQSINACNKSKKEMSKILDDEADAFHNCMSIEITKKINALSLEIKSNDPKAYNIMAKQFSDAVKLNKTRLRVTGSATVRAFKNAFLISQDPKYCSFSSITNLGNKPTDASDFQPQNTIPARATN